MDCNVRARSPHPTPQQTLMTSWGRGKEKDPYCLPTEMVLISEKGVRGKIRIVDSRIRIVRGNVGGAQSEGGGRLEP